MLLWSDARPLLKTSLPYCLDHGLDVVLLVFFLLKCGKGVVGRTRNRIPRQMLLLSDAGPDNLTIKIQYWLKWLCRGVDYLKPLELSGFRRNRLDLQYGSQFCGFSVIRRSSGLTCKNLSVHRYFKVSISYARLMFVTSCVYVSAYYVKVRMWTLKGLISCLYVKD